MTRCLRSNNEREAGMAQWRERLPPTNVARVRFWLGAICARLSLLLVLILALRVFLWVLSLVFLPPRKPTFLNSNSIRDLRVMGLSVVVLSFIHNNNGDGSVEMMMTAVHNIQPIISCNSPLEDSLNSTCCTI